MQFRGDLSLALAVAGALTSFADDDPEHAGEREALKLGKFGRDGRGIADYCAEGLGQAVDQVEREPVHRWADRREMGKFATPLFRGDAAYLGDEVENELAYGGG